MRFVILLMKNVAKSSAFRVDEGGGENEKKQDFFFNEHARISQIFNFVMIVCPFSSGDISKEVRGVIDKN